MFSYFCQLNIKLINQCEYKLKERRKNNEIIKYLKSIPSEKLKPIENKILNIYENFNTLTSDEYFNLQKQLNNYRSHHSEMIKNSVSKNMVSPEEALLHKPSMEGLFSNIISK